MATATQTAAPEAAEQWKATIRQQLDELNPADDITHAVIWFPTEDGGDPQILDLRDSEASAVVSAADRAEKLTGEVSVVALASLTDGAPFAERPAGTAAGDLTFEEDADKGQLFKVEIDRSQPTVVKLAFSSSIELSRSEADAMQLYNRLKEGKNTTIKVGAFISGHGNIHRRDGEGNVDAVVQTKSIKITDIHLGE